jgi:uncharacterized protein (DUF1330 family)
MSSYVIVDINITDPVGYEGYKQLAESTIQLFGGKYLVRGGACEIMEGDWPTGRLIILEFGSVEKAKAWLDSPEYAPARAMRHMYAISKMIMVEGV